MVSDLCRGRRRASRQTGNGTNLIDEVPAIGASGALVLAAELALALHPAVEGADGDGGYGGLGHAQPFGALGGVVDVLALEGLVEGAGEGVGRSCRQALDQEFQAGALARGWVDGRGGELADDRLRGAAGVGDGVLDVLDDLVLAEGVDEVAVAADDSHAAGAVPPTTEVAGGFGGNAVGDGVELDDIAEDVAPKARTRGEDDDVALAFLDLLAGEGGRVGVVDAFERDELEEVELVDVEAQAGVSLGVLERNKD